MFTRGFSTSSVTVAMRSYPWNAMNVSPIAGSTDSAPFENSGRNSPVRAAVSPKATNTPRMAIFTSVMAVSPFPEASVERAFSVTSAATARSA
jgi:hypothetical protein